MDIGLKDLKQAGFGFSSYDVIVPDGTTIADLMRPEAWMPVARRLRRFDRIRVVSADGKLDADLTVSNDPQNTGMHPEAQLRIIRVFEEPAEAQEPSA